MHALSVRFLKSCLLLLYTLKLLFPGANVVAIMYAIIIAVYSGYIMLTCPCNVHPLTSHLSIVKLGFIRICIISLFVL